MPSPKTTRASAPKQGQKGQSPNVPPKLKSQLSTSNLPKTTSKDNAFIRPPIQDVLDLYDLELVPIEIGKDHGYRLLTRKALKAGSLVYKVPILATAAVQEGNCSWCLQANEPGSIAFEVEQQANNQQNSKNPSQQWFRCSACKLCQYCSRACQRNDWITGHKLVCSKISQIKNEDMRREVEMVCKIIFAKINRRDVTIPTGTDEKELSTPIGNTEGKNQKYELKDLNSNQPNAVNWIELNLRVLDHLVHHYEQLPKLTRERMNQLAALIVSWFPNSPIYDSKNASSIKPAPKEYIYIPTLSEVQILLAKLFCNNFTLCDESAHPFGEVTAPFGSLMNHSCAPNCSYIYRGRYQLIRTIRDVEAFQELTSLYIDPMMKREERKVKLMENYYFECTCERCVDPKESTAGESSSSVVSPAQSTSLKSAKDLKPLAANSLKKTTGKSNDKNQLSNEKPSSISEKSSFNNEKVVLSAVDLIQELKKLQIKEVEHSSHHALHLIDHLILQDGSSTKKKNDLSPLLSSPILFDLQKVIVATFRNDYKERNIKVDMKTGIDFFVKAKAAEKSIQDKLYGPFSLFLYETIGALKWFHLPQHMYDQQRASFISFFLTSPNAGYPNLLSLSNHNKVTMTLDQQVETQQYMDSLVSAFYILGEYLIVYDRFSILVGLQLCLIAKLLHNVAEDLACAGYTKYRNLLDKFNQSVKHKDQQDKNLSETPLLSLPQIEKMRRDSKEKEDFLFMLGFETTLAAQKAVGVCHLSDGRVASEVALLFESAIAAMGERRRDEAAGIDLDH